MQSDHGIKVWELLTQNIYLGKDRVNQFTSFRNSVNNNNNYKNIVIMRCVK